MSEIDILSFGETMAMFVAEQTGDLAHVAQFDKRHCCHHRVIHRVVRVAQGQLQIGHERGKAQINVRIALLVRGR